jgi:hypothetical protein
VTYRFGQAAVPLQSVKAPYRVRDLVLQQVAVVRRQQLDLQHAREVQLRHAGATSSTLALPLGTPPAAAAAAAPTGPSVIEQLKDLAALKEAGILTDEEFAVQKTRILGGG